MRKLQIHPLDNVAVEIESGHKIALSHIKKNENVIKYGFPIGHAIKNINKGERVHVDHVKTNLNEKLLYTYHPEFSPLKPSRNGKMNAYIRENGEIGIRNDIWIVNTVGCVNKIAEKLSQLTGAFCFSHPYGCSQLGEDHTVTEKILKGLVLHPNAGGVLILGLGCENNNILRFKKTLKGMVDEKRIRFFNVQESEDEISEGIRLITELKEYAKTFQRQEVSLSGLKIGLKCGGSDSFSGITANPLIGQLSDRIIEAGGSSVLTEVPEMFGAETLLMSRCINKKVFEKTVCLINDFKDYFTSHDQLIYENPSPGNIEGGISTLEEKSLGCVQKGGTTPVVDVLDYGERVSKNGLSLLNGPGNDMVAITNLTAAGCHMILFSTGRGTPLGAPIPTIKISSNSELAEKKKAWIDFDAGPMLEEKKLLDDFFRYVIEVANGKETNNERNDYREIAIFKNGVTL